MPTPKQLTKLAYDLGVSGVDLNALTFAVVDAMEASGEYFGPYDSDERNFLEKYLIEEITPDRIDYCYSWIAAYRARNDVHSGTMIITFTAADWSEYIATFNDTDEFIAVGDF